MLRGFVVGDDLDPLPELVSASDVKELAISTAMAAEDAAGAVSALLGVPIDTVDAASCFAGNQVFRLRVGDRVLFLKIASKQDIRAEVAVLELLGSRCVPVPTVEAWDCTGELFGRPAALLRDVGGRPLKGGESELRLAGSHLRAVHDLELSGFGSMTAADGVLHGQHSTWKDAIYDRLSTIAPVIDAGLVPVALVDRTMELIESHVDLLADVTSARLLHGDFHPRHVFAVDGRVTGIIDWGDATAGDPIYDLARVFHSGVVGGTVERGSSLLANLLHGYGTPNIAPTDLHQKVRMYAAVFNLWSMIGEFADGSPWPPWWPAQTAALRAIIENI